MNHPGKRLVAVEGGGRAPDDLDALELLAGDGDLVPVDQPENILITGKPSATTCIRANTWASKPLAAVLTLSAEVRKRPRPETTRSNSGRPVAPDCLISSAVITVMADGAWVRGCSPPAAALLNEYE